jgi:hypothetical protein
MTKEERQRLMRSEARFDRKRGREAILFSAKDGVLFKYFCMRKRFWSKALSLAQYNLMRGIYDL